MVTEAGRLPAAPRLVRVRIERQLLATRELRYADGRRAIEGFPLSTGDVLIVRELENEADDIQWLALADDAFGGPSSAVGLPVGSWTSLPAVERNPNAPPPKKGFTTAEVASMFNRSPFTVRELCKKRLIDADRDESAGRTGAWMIPHVEVERLRRDGFPVMSKKHG